MAYRLSAELCISAYCGRFRRAALCSCADRRYSGIAANCARTDTATIAGRLASYSTPSSQLPINQNTPNEHSKIPYPVARLLLGTISVTAAFKIDSCAPIPTPHSAMPSSSKGTEGKAKMNTEKGALSTWTAPAPPLRVCHKEIRKSGPPLHPTSMAPAYSKGSVPVVIRPAVCSNWGENAVNVQEMCNITDRNNQ